jgi:hypothetical protein
MEKSAGNSLLTGITRSIENLPQPQTRQNDSTIFEMPRRSPEAWVRRDQPDQRDATHRSAADSRLPLINR